jgi:hypothetical protein
MLVLGAQHLEALAAGKVLSAKVVFNECGAIVFPAARQHREMEAEGISYQDNYKGNALAAMLAPGRIEIRYHNAFKDERVTQIVAELVRRPELATMAGWEVLYQRRKLGPAGGGAASRNASHDR